MNLGLSASSAVSAVSCHPPPPRQPSCWESPHPSSCLSFVAQSQWLIDVGVWGRAFSGMTLKSRPSSIAPCRIRQACLCTCFTVWPLCPLLIPRLSSTGVDLKNTNKHFACQIPSWNLLSGEPKDAFILQDFLALQFTGKKYYPRVKQNDIYIQYTQFAIYQSYLNILILSFFISKMGIIIWIPRCFHGG